MKKLTLALSILTLPLLGTVTRTAQGAAVLGETFPYPDGPLVGAPGSPWTTTSGTPLQQNVLSGVLSLTSAESEDTSAPFGQSFTTGNLYAGLTLNFSALPTAAGSYFTHFGNDASGFNARLFSSTTGAATGSFRLSIGNGTNASSTAAAAQFPLDLALNTNYRIVLRIDAATSISTLFINPVDETSLSVTGTDAPVANLLSTYRFRQAGGIGTLTVDDLSVSTTFAEASVAPVPEPSTYAMIGGGLGLLLLGQRVRRRRLA